MATSTTASSQSALATPKRGSQIRSTSVIAAATAMPSDAGKGPGGSRRADWIRLAQTTTINAAKACAWKALMLTATKRAKLEKWTTGHRPVTT